MFAYHAGIIGLESVEGGITFDQEGAYAIVLKERREVEGILEDRFTYRCPLNDKGKFKLTSATQRSREPIRVLRSHSVNGIWGPKAGIRYEGLFSVKGWSIRTAKTTSTTGEWKVGDIFFEIRIERNDDTPVEELMVHPTATEVDDYSEYKRLRRVYREQKRNGPEPTSSIKQDLQLAAKAAPPIQPAQPLMPPSAAPEASRKPSPSTLHSSMFRQPKFDEGSHVPPSPGQEVVSPMAVTNVNQFSLTMRKRLAVAPAQSNRRPSPSPTGPPPSDLEHVTPPVSYDSSNNTGVSADNRINIREVAPWIEYDVGLNIPSPASQAPAITTTTREAVVTPHSLASTSTSAEEEMRSAIKAKETIAKPATVVTPNPLNSQQRRKSDDNKGMTVATLSPTGTASRRDGTKSILLRSRNPISKLFDGVKENVEEDYFGDAVVDMVRTASVGEIETPKTPPKLPPRRHQRSSSDNIMRVLSPTQTTPTKDLFFTSDGGDESPLSPFAMRRRRAIYPPSPPAHHNDYNNNHFSPFFPTTIPPPPPPRTHTQIHDDGKSTTATTMQQPKSRLEEASNDPFVVSPLLPLTSHVPMSPLPVPLQNVIAPPPVLLQSRTASLTPFLAERKHGRQRNHGSENEKETSNKWPTLQMMEGAVGLEVLVEFRDPWCSAGGDGDGDSGGSVSPRAAAVAASRRRMERQSSVSVAPHVVL
ncbi:hypothetical protein N0V83_003425 [Neocucurbitaria cava]|uniref:YDG domain-containing protein n=1 Tax=Neocucurbitaria cava TaxID=798079 RepID=A0A9W8YBM9_9PLEO|nr:hypothetical protein N0V83_003425 [Neocucurbitaria cava]